MHISKKLLSSKTESDSRAGLAHCHGWTAAAVPAAAATAVPTPAAVLLQTTFHSQSGPDLA